MATTKRSKQSPHRRDHVSARVDHEVLEIVERVAEAERRPISNLVRNILADWAASRRTQHGQAA